MKALKKESSNYMEQIVSAIPSLLCGNGYRPSDVR
jgi:hypothetical protein